MAAGLAAVVAPGVQWLVPAPWRHFLAAGSVLSAGPPVSGATCPRTAARTVSTEVTVTAH